MEVFSDFARLASSIIYDLPFLYSYLFLIEKKFKKRFEKLYAKLVLFFINSDNIIESIKPMIKPNAMIFILS